MLKSNPIDWISNQIKRIPEAVRWTFAAAFFGGILIHFYAMSHKFFNYFEMGNIFSKMPFMQPDTIALGRWFMPIATNLFTSFSMPVYNSIIALCYMAISAALVVDLLQIKSKAYGALFGLTFVSFPGLACVFSFGVNSDEITLSLLLAVLSAYAFYKWKYGIVWGALLLCFSLGAYQPFMSATIGVIYMMLFMKTFREKTEFKPFALSAVKAVVMMVIGFALYYGILQVMIAVTGVQLSDYHGVDSMTSFTVKGICKGLVYTYGYFLSYFFSTSYLYTVGRIICNMIGAVAFVGIIISKIKTTAGKERKCANALLLILFCFLPLGVNAAPFLMADRVGAGVDRYMIFSLMFLWALLLAMLDDCKESDMTLVSEKAGGLMQWAGLLAVIVSIGSGFIISNQAYHRMEAMTETTGSLMNRIAMRMEEHPQWHKDIPVYFVNCRALMNENYDFEIPEYEEIRNMSGTFLAPSYSEEALVDYMEVYLHFPIKEASLQERDAVEKTAEFATMKSYPAESSVQVIDGVMVVKISEEE